MLTTPWQRVLEAGVLTALGAACIYLPDAWWPDAQPGDVSGVTVGTPPGTTGETLLAGTRISLGGSHLVRRSGADGRFVLRNLPAGTFHVSLQWPADATSQPLLRQATFTITERDGTRASLDLGRLHLGTPGTIRGHVELAPGTPAVAMTDVVVLLEGAQSIGPSPDGSFAFASVAPGRWSLVAAGPGVMADRVEVDVAAGRAVDAALVLRTAEATELGTLTAEILTEPGGPTVDTVDATLFQPDGMPGPTHTSGLPSMNMLAPPGIYTLTLVASAEEYLPLQVGTVAVLPGTITPLGTLLLTTLDTTPCADPLPDGTCAQGDGGIPDAGTNGDGGPGMDGGASSTDGGAVPFPNVTAVATGPTHSCAIQGGDVYCWGDNIWNQLGDGTVLHHSMPERVPGVMNAIGVAVGERQSCAVQQDGTVLCWGDNGSGQLGLGNMLPAPTPQPLPITNGAGLASGLAFTCALTTNADVVCWGPGLPNGQPTPQLVPGLSGVLALAAGCGHICAATATGVSCWGDNSVGQFGNSNSSSNIPTPATGVGAVTSLAAGCYSSCAVTAGGVLQCWGAYDSAPHFSAVTLPTSNVDEVAGGAGGLCIRLGGSVQCLGDNGQGQLGNGTMTGSTSFQPVVGILDATGLVPGALSEFTCAIRAGGLMSCWGDNRWGQLGSSLPTFQPAPVTSPQSGNVVAVGAGWQNTCAVVADGTMWCWGVNDVGQLGRPAPAQSSVPIFVNVAGASAVVVGDQHACALVGDTVTCWGSNARGELASANAADHGPQAVPGLSGVTDVAAGANHTCAVSGGQVWCWGYNFYRQLGDGTNTTPTAPVQVTGLLDAVAVTAGEYHSCALRSDQTVTCWGSNVFGELGDGAVSNGARTTPTGVGMVRAVAAGGSHTCVITNAGTVGCWGDGTDGALGDGTGTSSPVMVPVQGLDSVDQLSVGVAHVCASRSTGEVFCWGGNKLGSVGDGTAVNRLAPVQVQRVTAPSVLETGDLHTCVIQGGALRCWGDDLAGQLGIGRPLNSNLPLDVSYVP